MATATSASMLAQTSNSPPLVSFASTWSYAFIAAIIESILFGVSMTTATSFFASRTKAGLRSTEYFIAGHHWILIIMTFTCIQFFAMVVYAYNTFVVNFGNESRDWMITPAACTQQMSLYLVIFSGQMFYISKLWKSTHKFLYVFPTAILSLMALGAGIAEVVRAIFKDNEFYELQYTIPTFVLQSGTTVACDLIISVLLCYDIRGQRSGFRDVDEILTQMSYYVINCGVATSLSALAMMILFIVSPSTLKFQIAQQTGVQLYGISVIAMISSDGDLKKVSKMENKSIFLHRLGHIDGSPSLNVDTHVETTKTWDSDNVEANGETTGRNS